MLNHYLLKLILQLHDLLLMAKQRHERLQWLQLQSSQRLSRLRNQYILHSRSQLRPPLHQCVSLINHHQLLLLLLRVHSVHFHHLKYVLVNLNVQVGGWGARWGDVFG